MVALSVDGYTAGLTRELPDQTGLDYWSSEHTRGLIEQFSL
ncbi:hypothetical protein [Mycobacterium sp. 852002-51152_SCH6134967]|nr:hypothetical protein [Mycobacterium sp. 852002-51152_SCH6134967]